MPDLSESRQVQRSRSSYRVPLRRSIQGLLYCNSFVTRGLKSALARLNRLVRRQLAEPWLSTSVITYHRRQQRCRYIRGAFFPIWLSASRRVACWRVRWPPLCAHSSNCPASSYPCHPRRHLRPHPCRMRHRCRRKRPSLRRRRLSREPPSRHSPERARLRRPRHLSRLRPHRRPRHRQCSPLQRHQHHCKQRRHLRRLPTPRVFREPCSYAKARMRP